MINRITMNQQMNKKTKQLLRLLLFVVSLQSLVEAVMAQSKPLNLKAAIELALNNNRSLKADSLGITETLYKNKELAGWFLPQVNYASGVESNLAIPSQMVPGSMVGQPSKELVPVQFGTRYGMKSGVEVSQTVFRKDLSVKRQAADVFDGDYRYKASSIGLSTSVSLFDGNRRKNRLNATQIQLDQLQLESR